MSHVFCIFLAAFFVVSTSAFCDDDCPQPIVQVARDLKGKIEGDVETALKVGKVSASGDVDMVTNDVLHKYPDAHSLVLQQNILSILCNKVLPSPDYSKDFKQEIIRKLTDSIFGSEPYLSNKPNSTPPSPPAALIQPQQPATPGRSIQTPPNVNEPNRRESQTNAVTASELQRALIKLGFLAGAVDGYIGPETRNGIRGWQRSTGSAQTGELTPDQTESLIRAAAKVSAGADAPQQAASESGSDQARATTVTANSPDSFKLVGGTPERSVVIDHPKLRNFSIIFDEGSISIPMIDLGQIDEAAKNFKWYGSQKIVVEAYALAGNGRDALRLANLRAQAVTKMLVQTGIPPEDIEARAYDAETSSSPRDQKTGDAESVRIQIE